MHAGHHGSQSVAPVSTRQIMRESSGHRGLQSTSPRWRVARTTCRTGEPCIRVKCTSLTDGTASLTPSDSQSHCSWHCVRVQHRTRIYVRAANLLRHASAHLANFQCPSHVEVASLRGNPARLERGAAEHGFQIQTAQRFVKKTIIFRRDLTFHRSGRFACRAALQN